MLIFNYVPVEHAAIFIDSERNKVGYTLLYETTVLKYNYR